MTPQTETLIQILGKTDAAFLPLRSIDWFRRTPAVIAESRRRHATGGVLVRPPDGSPAGRQAFARLLSGLVDEGLVTQGGDQRKTLAKLTCYGDSVARATAGLPGLRECINAMVVLGRIRNGYGEASEVHPRLCCRRGGYDQTESCYAALDQLQQIFLPGLARRWILSASDSAGRVRYRLVFGEGDLPASLPDGLPPCDPEAREAYYRAREHERWRLRNLAPDSPEDLGFVPLSVSEPANSPWAWSDPQ